MQLQDIVRAYYFTGVHYIWFLDWTTSESPMTLRENFGNSGIQ